MAKLTLTFDNGPTPGVTDGVLDVLAARELLATFFVLGKKLTPSAGRDLAERARSEGHWVGNHTMNHGEPLGLLSNSAVERAEIADAEGALGDLNGPPKLFRPTGHGSIGPHLLSPAAADELIGGGYTMVLWSLFVRDSKMPEGWVDRALARLPEREWHVLVVHDLPTGAMDELPRFLDGAAERGYEFVQDFPEDCTPLRAGQPSPHFAERYVQSKVVASAGRKS